ncbi:MAG: thymidylate kinase [Acidobacteria bacterium]|nr:thymidylate kinase [Acidobacteriota bacterium]
MHPILISFSGIDGAGKSTQIEKLSGYLRAQAIPVGTQTFWDQVAVLAPLRSGFSRRVLESDGEIGTRERPANRNDKNSQFLPLLLGRAVLYLFDVFRLRRVVVRAKSMGPPGGIIIFDRYIYDQLAALPLRRWLARSYARLIVKLAPRPDLCFLVDAVPEEARARKPEYPVEFLREYRDSYLELCRLVPLNFLPPGGADDVHTAIVGEVQKLLGDSAQTPVQSAVAA